MRTFFIAVVALAIAVENAPGLAVPQNAGGQNTPPTESVRKDLLERVFANQHKDDGSLELFQRTEHRRFGDRHSVTDYTDDRVMRIIPTGVGSARVTLEDHGHATDAREIRTQMALVERQLEAALDSSNPQTKRDREKFDRRNRERTALVSEVKNAFIFTFEGREVRDGRLLAKYELEPSPDYHATSRETELFSHSRATVWVDEKAGQVARLQGELTSDIPFYGGLAAKVYRGGTFVLEQTEVEPGIWLPSVQQYDFSWRKMFFAEEFHEKLEDSHYVRVGPAAQELAAVRKELADTAGNPASARNP
jgi:hypothetical protein